MINPLQPVYEFWLQFYGILPYPITQFVSLNWIYLVGLSVIMLLWRAKH